MAAHRACSISFVTLALILIAIVLLPIIVISFFFPIICFVIFPIIDIDVIILVILVVVVVAVLAAVWIHKLVVEALHCRSHDQTSSTSHEIVPSPSTRTFQSTVDVLALAGGEPVLLGGNDVIGAGTRGVSVQQLPDPSAMHARLAPHRFRSKKVLPHLNLASSSAPSPRMPGAEAMSGIRQHPRLRVHFHRPAPTM